MAETVVRPAGRGAIELLVGDITRLPVDAIVNAANSELRHGGGVAAAIARAGGPAIQAESDGIGGCPTGDAVVTGAGALPARHVIHAVGPVWGHQPDEESDRLLRSAARRALVLARERSLGSIALPAISSGIFGFPVERAARLLLGEAAAHLAGGTALRRVIFCLFDRATYEAYRSALDEILPDDPPR